MSIKIDLKIFLFLFLFLLTSQFEIYIILFVFAILHELGHLVAGIILKFRPEEIRLTPLGLQISFKTQPKEVEEENKVSRDDEINLKKKRAKEINIRKAIIAMAGPITNFAIAIIAILLASFNGNAQNMYIYQIIIYSNFIIAVFNLIPIYPMDGGRILKEMLNIACGRKRAYKITYITSKTILIILTAIVSIAILFVHNIALLLILAYLWYLEINEIRIYNRRKNIEYLVENLKLRDTSLYSK